MPPRSPSARRALRWSLAAGLALTAALLLPAASRPQPAPHADATLSFGRDVRPILANNCFKCHGPDEQTRQAGLRLDTRDGATNKPEDSDPAVIPGNPDHSLLIQAVSHPDPAMRMPPPEVSKHGLSPADIATLRQWIAEGAAYEPHWSFVPPQQSPAPAVSDAAWCRADLDRFVLARLDRENLKPSPEAARETLLRRVSLDVTGLPPTPAELDAFLADAAPDAYEKAVDRLLASPRYGEKWARWWLDMARYADTKGYEKDDRRTIWPYRDWVIRALNADMPLDQFTVEQLAGDMLPNATREQLVATAFHRNTMTNDEGGTDNEEFRVAAVIDRVNTTMEIWQGVTIACAQCHTHKYDPLTHTDYYRLFAIFNNTEDADADPEAPFLRLQTDEQEKAIAAARSRVAELDRDIDARLAAVPEASYAADPPLAPAGETREIAVIDDLLPPGAAPSVQNLEPAAWNWTANPAPSHGVRAFGARSRGGAGQQFFEHAPALELADGDTLFVHAFIDPANPPKQIMLQWFCDDDSRWEHRAFWGDDKLTYGGGPTGSPARLRIGDLPPSGAWARLEIPAVAVGLAGKRVTGWAFSQFDGAVSWDHAGIRTTRALDDRARTSFPAWLRDHNHADLTAERRDELLREYLRTTHEPTRLTLLALQQEIESLTARIQQLEREALNVPVMHELPHHKRRVTHRFLRGSFLSPAEETAPGIPAIFASDSTPSNRLDFAHWLMSPENPLTARALANRVCEQLWGAGIAETLEDLGTQGIWPADQQLLDHLALQLRDTNRWSLKSFLRTLVTSATYRQSSAATADLLARDPANRLFARGPRFRLDAETIRDNALAAAGLLSTKMHGPPVFPPQPDGLWIMIYSADRWNTSTGEDRYRRGIYTFWRRTVPHPAMTTFDAPSREFCVSRRIRTNTPLQSLVTLNDPASYEAAQALARRVLREAPPDDAARLSLAMRLVVARALSPDELARLRAFLDAERARFAAAPDAAARAATIPLGPLPDGLTGPEAAAWSSLASILLNLDETLTKE